MFSTIVQFRMDRILNARSKRAVIVAMDHGVTGSVPGMENIERSLSKVIEGKPDAILLNLGVAEKCLHLFKGKEAPSIILTLDFLLTSTVPGGSSKLIKHRMLNSVENALKVGADAVKVLLVFGRREMEDQIDNVKEISAVARECEKWAMPLMVEAVLWGREIPDDKKNDFELIKHACRIAVELGADMLKIPYTGSYESFRQITETCLVPIFILGGPKTDNNKEILEVTSEAMKAGAKGVVFGRNIWQAPEPGEIIKDLKEIVYMKQR